MNFKHGYAKKGKSNKTYYSWSSMKRRCAENNVSHKKYYFDKGISVCEQWHNSFKAFLDDMGEIPEGLTLDRIDNNKGYFKENCRWATTTEQNNNKSNIKNIKWGDNFYTIVQLEDYLKINRGTLKQWLRKGLDIETKYNTYKPRNKNALSKTSPRKESSIC